jgi:glycerophosphoryl diester phosphodiesterase
MLHTLPYPAIFAHRGASAYAPENTLSAFVMALEQGADGVELDAKLSADGQVMVIHDATVDRTTNGHGRVKDLSLADLRSLDAGGFFAEKYRGEKVPTLEEVFEALGKRMFINVELTNYNTPADHLVESVCMLVKKLACRNRSFFLLSWRRISRRHVACYPRFLEGCWPSMGFLAPGRAHLVLRLADIRHYILI